LLIVWRAGGLVSSYADAVAHDTEQQVAQLRALLEAERVEFRLDGTLDLQLFRWEPPARPVSLRGRGGDRRTGRRG
jgi:hypothetical protein